MNRQDVAYGVIGVMLGLVLGFFVANASYTQSSITQAAKKAESASVNTGRDTQLPANHPDISGAEANPGSAGPLPADHPDISGGATAAIPASAPVELPSLDPLPASSKEERTEHKYKNIQVLRGLPAERLEKVMFAFKAALGVEDCTFCHVKDQWEKDDKQNKQIARKMIKMTRDLNNIYVGGIGRVSCFTCHRGQQRPPK